MTRCSGEHTATTVSVRDGRTLITDGPFAETHEHLGGYYVLDCRNLDEALELAALCPMAEVGLDRGAAARQVPGVDHTPAADVGGHANDRARRGGCRAGLPRAPGADARRAGPRARATSSSPRTRCRTRARSRCASWAGTVPDDPVAWLLTAARNRAIDRLRRARLGREKQRADADDRQVTTMTGFDEDRLVERG